MSSVRHSALSLGKPLCSGANPGRESLDDFAHCFNAIARLFSHHRAEHADKAFAQVRVQHARMDGMSSQ